MLPAIEIEDPELARTQLQQALRSASMELGDRERLGPCFCRVSEHLLVERLQYRCQLRTGKRAAITGHLKPVKAVRSAGQCGDSRCGNSRAEDMARMPCADS
ncbi:hypothetical protein B8X04_15395 [Brevibacterium casei]|uniref:Uncharacterized protein n=1 Tax=Brevibacterium casei TaxID=33889 RepID=A0A269Z7B5_9MICO|nr:hypothetical protein AVP41_01267 [Microbacterium sp. TNHR37B]NYF30411.1 hypothetical protein [Microbacterium sp. JAI119]PAK93549.1 hypothetical protein B8X04_15395 [Brevibacterium casei]